MNAYTKGILYGLAFFGIAVLFLGITCGGSAAGGYLITEHVGGDKTRNAAWCWLAIMLFWFCAWLGHLYTEHRANQWAAKGER